MEGKMSKRYKVKRFSSCYLMNWVDNKTNKELTALEIEEILHKQEKRIAELEEQLKKSQKQLANSKLEMLHDMFCSTINNRILQNYVCSIIRGEIEELKNDGKL